MRKICLLFMLATLKMSAQPAFIPEDLSYDFRITKEDLGIKGNISFMSQHVRWVKPEFEPSEACYAFDTDIYEEQHYINGYSAPLKGHSPCINLLKNQTYALNFSKDGQVTFFAWQTPKVASTSQFFMYAARPTESATYFYAANQTIDSVICKSFDFDKKFYLLYDSQGRVVEKKVLIDPKSTETVYPTTYEYDSQGRVVKVTTIPTYKGKPRKHVQTRNYEYSQEDGKLVVSSVCVCLNENHNKERKTQWVYDANNRLINHNVSVFKINSDKLYFIQSFTYKYNESGQLTQINGNGLNIDGSINSALMNIQQLQESFGLEETTTYTYNEHGDIEEVRHTKANSINITTYQYKYDSHGNWIEKKISSNDGLVALFTRDITYWE